MTEDDTVRGKTAANPAC
ncbi:hypothetical protein NEL96_03760 [Escherichia coli]|nr:hypothetical protein [Escherichia coli]MDI1001139.1 hypothetical protein [Escherichia coli]MDI1079093.1 hypothetical protein [Escherichia coli]